MARITLKGPRTVLAKGGDGYPPSLQAIPAPPQQLYVLGNPACLVPGLAVIGARKATPYGLSCARHFARLAAAKGICIISGGARGCDGESHRAALEVGAPTVVFLGGGCDRYYPACHGRLFQEIIDGGGAVVSEHPWDADPMPYMFRERNRLIAGLAQAVLIVEAGLPSGTFSTADDALNCGKEVLVVPGAITSAASRGSNRLLYQGAVPIVDDESFEQALFDGLGVLQQDPAPAKASLDTDDPLLQALLAQPLTMEELHEFAVGIYGPSQARSRINHAVFQGESQRLIERHADGRWGPLVT